MFDISNDLVSAQTALEILGGKETPISETTLYRGIRDGRYPRPIRIGPNAVRWKRSELVAFLDRAAAERGEIAPPKQQAL